MTTQRKPPVDRRIQRTQRHLHEALSTLIHEKPYDAIAVKEILDRADVGRSTFYTHFRGKDELLVSGMRDMLRSSRSPSSRREDVLWFSLPVLSHLDQHRRTSGARMGSRGRTVLHQHLQQVVAELVADALKRDRMREDFGRNLPPELLAQHVAATFVLVLNWWVESGSELTAVEMDERFRALVHPAVALRTSST
jgi:AcrR family transcriptional regulator